jgi:hypothetical protein
MIEAVGLIARGYRAVPVTVKARTPVAPCAGFDIVVPVELPRIRRALPSARYSPGPFLKPT